MSIFRWLHSDTRDVLPEPSLSPDPEPPKQGAMGGGVRPEFDPCGVGPIQNGEST